MRGVVTGGWPFVVAAYTLTSAALLVYGVGLIAKLRDAVSRTAKENR